jgi:hypothetical protein
MTDAMGIAVVLLSAHTAGSAGLGSEICNTRTGYTHSEAFPHPLRLGDH